MHVGKAIRDLRHKKSLSRAELAKASNLSEATVWRMEKERMPSKPSLTKVCKGFDIEVPILLFLSIQPSDVKPGKERAYSALYPALESIVEVLFTDI